MDTPDRAQTTALVQSLAGGDRHAAEQLLPLVYDELKRMAEQLMRREPAGHTLQPTALVHEVFVRLVGDEGADWEHERHFLRVAAVAMRSILVSAARARAAEKRGGEQRRVTWTEQVAAASGEPADAIEVDAVLERLQQLDATLAEIVQLRVFAGMEVADIAALLGIPLRSLERKWRFAKSWLAREVTRLRAGE